MQGTITAVIRRREGQNGGYGFLKDEKGAERFFHARNLFGTTFEMIRENDTVRFDPIDNTGKKNGLRADRVEVVAGA